MIEPLRIVIDVRCPPVQAFDVFTRRIDLWWPRGASVSENPALRVVLEGWPGGRIFERLPSGEEHDWGEITRWEPPQRLAYSWHIRRDRTAATDVDVAFLDGGDGTTRVEITHSGWERLGDEGPSWRDANLAGWDGVLPRFVAACVYLDVTLSRAASRCYCRRPM